MIDSRQHIIGKLVPFDFETITVAGTAIGLTASKIEASPKPKQVMITSETAPLRYKVDGSDPTASVGHFMSPRSSLILEGRSQINNFKAIRTGATSAELSCTYLR